MIENAIKGPITSILGLIIIITTVYGVGSGTIPMIWEGIAGFAVGTVFIFMKDKIVDIITSAIKAIITKTTK